MNDLSDGTTILKVDKALLQLDFTAHRDMVRSGEVSAFEILQQQFSCIEQLNPLLNAYLAVATVDSNTRDRIESLANTKFAGLSFAVKDNIDVKGFATTAGMATRIGQMPENDAFAITKLREAGASFIGKLNMHEGALGATNQNYHFGNCYNPHKVGFTPGGSSGGSASAVAAGMTSLALGTDTMGSVRIPASYCGIFGFKPSRSAVSNRGSVVCSRLMDTFGPMARSARDLTFAMQIMSQLDNKSADSIAINHQPELNAKSTTLLVPENLSELGVDINIIADFESNLHAFKDLGCLIERFNFTNYDFAAARRAGLLICEAEMRIEHADDWANNRDKFSPYMQSMLGFIDSKTPMDIIQSERVLDDAVVFSKQLFQKGDLLLLPTAPQRAFSFDESVPSNQADLTSFANQAGLPAVSMPMKTTAELPAGMQLVGPPGTDFLLLELCEQWQKETQFNYQLPQITLS